MKSLAKQVQAYMDWRSSQSGEAFGPADMAAQVARLQPTLPVKNRCKRQNIEQLIGDGLMTPRYIVELAQAMGTTAEILKHGGYRPPNKAKPAGEHEAGGAKLEPDKPDITYSPWSVRGLLDLAARGQALPDWRQSNLISMLGHLVSKPEEAPQIAEEIAGLLGVEQAKKSRLPSSTRSPKRRAGGSS